ncbi:hypothetical protein KBZ94_40375 [Streptomyces sp. RM72]|uniref:hypothetical protein n=1 Tax=Streptomyces sp. RM72 TaxID=1115510 RepID=UPI001B35CF62|nr:hypothetical protein [Streptomyces sp. RM72]MBQ0891102.1 hypothetical protein [Streptomyces sp. RM72]
MTRDGTRRHDHTASIRRAVMLPGFGDAPRESVPQTLLDAFADEAEQVTPPGTPPADADTARARVDTDGGDVVPPEEPHSEPTGRHRQRRPRSRRKPAFVAAAAVGAVLTAMPFLSQGGSGRHDSQGRPTPSTAVPDEEGFLDAAEGPGETAAPVTLAGAQVRGPEGPGDASPDPRSSADRTAGGEDVGTVSAHAGGKSSHAPSRNAPRDTVKPVPRTTQPVRTGSVVVGTHVFRAGAPVRAGAASVSMEPDGNFVVRDGSGVVRWAANTASLADRAVFQSDGNLVVVAADGTTVWHSGTAGHPGAELVLQESGRLLIRSATGAVLWSTGGGG